MAMKKKNYPQQNINPEIVSDHLVLNLDAARPVKPFRVGVDDNELSIFWKDWNQATGDLNFPAVVWNDWSGNGLNAKINHFGPLKRAWDNNRLIFTGSSNDYVEVTADGRRDFAQQEFTIEVWASVVLGGNKPLFVYESAKEGKYFGVHLRLVEESILRFHFHIDGKWLAVNGLLPDNFDQKRINQFVCTFKDGEQRLYINNQELKYKDGVLGRYAGEILYSPFPAPVSIGTSVTVGKDVRFIGEIASVRYYKSVLSKDEINQNYIAGTGELKVLPTTYINVKDYGAKGDGVTDDTAAIQRALDAAADYEIGSDVKRDDNGNYLKDDNGKYMYQEPIAKEPMGSGNVYIPPGVYMIDAVKAVEMRSNTNLYMHSKATLQAKPNGIQSYTVLGIRQVKNVGVYGGNIRGERNEHKGTQGQWGMGISIVNSYNVTVEGTRADECWADGFYIGTEVYYKPVAAAGERYTAPEDIRLIDIKADRNRRQGISLISGRNVDIIRPRLTNTGGFGDPEAGIDIEPDHSDHILENIYIEDAVTKNNSGPGILVCLHNLVTFRFAKDESEHKHKEISIVVNGHHDTGSLYGVFVQDKGLFVKGNNKTAIMESIEVKDANGNPVLDDQGRPVKKNTPKKDGATVTGFVTLENCIWEKARVTSLRIADHLAHIPEEYPNELAKNVNTKDRPPQVYKLEVNNCTFKNIGQAQSRHLQMDHMTTAGSLGNVFINKPTFCDDTDRDKSSIFQFIYKLPTYNWRDQMYDIEIHNPKYEGGYQGYQAMETVYEKTYIIHDEDEKIKHS